MRNLLIILFSVVFIAAVEGVRQLLRWSRERRASATTRSSRFRSGVTRLRVVMREFCGNGPRR